MSLRFVVLQIVPPNVPQADALKDMREAELLVQTFGGIVIDKSIQHRFNPNPSMYIGKGKVEWLKAVVKEQKIDVVVLNALVNSGQLFRLEKELWEVNTQIQVWDRVDLILNIFDQHAASTEAKLQIQLARIQHRGPRIYGLGKTRLSRQGGGIGTRGLGETNIEIEKRTIKKVRQGLQKQLKELAKKQENRMYERKKLGINTVAIIGYTSAGKTTLFNALTGKSKKMDQSLFTTLDSVVGKFKIPEYDPTILISDTIGFIEDLPPFLIEAFRSTLLESLAAKVLLHVVDASDPKVAEKIEVVNQILQQLAVQKKPVLVFNKIDLLDEITLKTLQEKYKDTTALFLSAKNKIGIDPLKKVIQQLLSATSTF